MAELAELLRRGFEEVQAGRLEGARPILEEAVGLAPESLDANAMAGFVAAKQRRWAEAHKFYRKAAELKPEDGNLVLSAGATAFEALDLKTAQVFLRRAVQMPGVAGQAKYVLAKVLCFENETIDAVELLKEAVAAGIAPGESQTWLAQALRNAGYPDEALPWHEASLNIAKKHVQAASMRAASTTYAAKVGAKAVFEAHRQYGQWLAEGSASLKRPVLKVSRGPRPAKLRIGLLSPDLRRHSVTLFLMPIVQGLNKERFEFVGYHAVPDEDSYTEQYRAACVMFRNITGQHGEQIAEQIAADGVHILIDLAGHTTNTRMPVLAIRSAPVQMTYLGYPNTTGIAECDWRLTDALTDPAGFESLSVERLMRIEGCSHTFRPIMEGPDPGEPPVVRNGFVTFGCFGAIQKFNDVLVGMLAKTLLAVPGSRLLIKHSGMKSERARTDMAARFAKAGMKDQSRLMIEGPVEGGTEAMLSNYLRADIALDTFPYHGTTTTCESLYMGIPVVTRVGNRVAARVGLSLLTAAGVPELAAEDEPGFVRIAANLARDIEKLKDLRRTLRGRFMSTIGNEADFCKRFEAAIDRAWDESKPA